MTMETYYQQFENCLQEERPFCTDACPFRLDFLDFLDKMSQKRYNAAFKIYRDAVAFPDIVAALCPQYCAEHCLRKDFGGAVQINLLEKTCLAKAKRKAPNQYNLPSKKGKIAIIGAGLSGLSCALRLAAKKYEVVIYEKSSHPGGQLHDLLPEKLFMDDIDRQFQFETYTLHFNTEVTNINQLSNENFDAVYVATGKDGADFGALSCDGAADGAYAFFVDSVAVFAGGSLLGKDVLHAAADGLQAAHDIEGYLKTKVLRYSHRPAPSKAVVDTAGTSCIDPVTPISGDVFTEEEATEEIARCLRCQCNACRTHCDLTNYFDKWPLQMRDEIMTTTMPANSMIRKAPAIKLINMCTQCGLCNETCPGQIELGNMIKEARKIMHQIDRMPGAYHQFWVRDMEFANGPYASIAKPAPGKDSCSHAFFPGCHLGAANPAYVKKAYHALLSANADTGLLLRCCGIPADWAGNEALHLQELESLKADWKSIGSPTLIMACPSCLRHFREYLPEIHVISLYEIMADWQLLPEDISTEEDETLYSIFDPCAARNDLSMQTSVRKLLSASHVLFEELPGGTKHGCCSFGGNMEIAGPKLAKKIAEDRSHISDNPYITYCINCRDVFFDDGKPVRHLLDLLLDIEPPKHRLPTVTERRCNRVLLKEQLLDEIWRESMQEKPEVKYDLLISEEIKEKMNRLKLLEEDVCHVLEMGEFHGRRAFDPEKGSYKCYREIGRITCWAEYRPQGSQYEILNVYIHRMKIELEVVFNGKKTDYDLR